MKHYKRIHDHINNTRAHQMKPKLSIFILLAGTLLSLLFLGCGVFTPESEYEPPQLPKSELATIKIDTEGGWLQRYNLIVFRIDGKLALRKKIDALEKVSIDDEILVAPGKHNMSVLVVYESFHGDTPGGRQHESWFSADVETGSTYLLKVEGGREADFRGKLVDTNGGKVVSKPRLLDQFGFSGSL